MPEDTDIETDWFFYKLAGYLLWNFKSKLFLYLFCSHLKFSPLSGASCLINLKLNCKNPLFHPSLSNLFCHLPNIRFCEKNRKRNEKIGWTAENIFDWKYFMKWIIVGVDSLSYSGRAQTCCPVGSPRAHRESSCCCRGGGRWVWGRRYTWCSPTLESRWWWGSSWLDGSPRKSRRQREAREKPEWWERKRARPSRRCRPVAVWPHRTGLVSSPPSARTSSRRRRPWSRWRWSAPCPGSWYQPWAAPTWQYFWF